ncbi:MAG TPA: SpoIIE family protein phosphatase, partial [Streptosporangiaceae bacterium]|nr:SpoIIE family protein phosphatase [Streptosporangiaceae bacterium]
MATRHGSDTSDQPSEATGLKTRVGALRTAAGMPEAEPRSLLDAALAELDAAVTALDMTGASDGPEGEATAQHGPTADRRLLQAVFQQVPVALFLLGADGAVRRANSAAAQLVGAAPGYATGRSFAALVEPAHRAAVRSQLAAVARTGVQHVLSCGLYGPAGVRQCQVMIRTVNVRGDDDKLLVVASPRSGPRASDRKVAVAPDTTEPVTTVFGTTGPDAAVSHSVAAMTRRVDVVSAVSRLLLENVASSEGQLLQRFARLLADHVATWVIVDVMRGGRLERHSAAGPDEETSAGQVQAVMTVRPSAESAPGQVAQSGTALVLAHPDDESILGATEAGVPLLLLLGGASVLSAPVSAGDVCYGAITLVRNAAAGTFGLADVGIAEDAAEQLATTLDLQRTMRQRADAAEALQVSLLPRELKPVPGVEIAAAHIPATQGRAVGGDFYDIYKTPEGWGIAIGDVTGKGRDAASVTAAARNAIRVLAHWNADPAGVLRGANEIMLAEAFGGRFVTADAAHLSWREGALRVVLGSAGHPGPVLVKQDGRTQAIEGGGEPLGIFRDCEAAVSELTLSQGDVLFFCTDGLTGARNPELGYFGERLADALAGLCGQPASDIVDGMRRMLVGFCEGLLLDDVTMLALRVGEAPGP